SWGVSWCRPSGSSRAGLGAGAVGTMGTVVAPAGGTRGAGERAHRRRRGWRRAVGQRGQVGHGAPPTLGSALGLVSRAPAPLVPLATGAPNKLATNSLACRAKVKRRGGGAGIGGAGARGG